MKYQGKITDPKDLVTKEYVDTGLSGKQNTLTFDDVPTAGSSNPVKSSGIKSAINSQAEKIESGLAIIVDGDTCSIAVPIGGYAYIKNNTHGLAEGLYKNTSSSAFPVSGGTANSSVFTADSGGVLNNLHRDTGWINLSSYLVNCSARSGDQFTPKVRIIDNIYFFSGEVYFPTAPASTGTIQIMRDIPQKLWPAAQVTASGVTFAYNPFTMWFSINGVVTVNPESRVAQQEWEGFQLGYFSGRLQI